MRGFPRLCSIVLAMAVAVWSLSPVPAGAQESTDDLDQRELWTLVIATLFFGGDVEAVAGLGAEVSMADGSPLRSGLPTLTRVGHVAVAGGPDVLYPGLGAPPGVEVLAPGDPTFVNDVPTTHLWVLEFETAIAELSGVGEFGIALDDAGGLRIADPLFPFSPLNEATRAVAVTFALQQSAAVYSVANQTGAVDVFPSPFYVARSATPEGRGLLVFAGPLGPAWWAYVSGAAEGDATDPAVLEQLAGARTTTQPAATAPLSIKEAEQLVAGSPEATATLAAVLGESATAAPPDGGAATDPDETDPAVDDAAAGATDAVADAADDAEQAVDDAADDAEQAVDDAADDAEQAVDDTEDAGSDDGPGAALFVIIGLVILFLVLVLLLLVVPRMRAGARPPVGPEGAVAKKPRGPVHKRGAGGGYTRPVVQSPAYLPPQEPLDPAMSTSGGGWVELGDAGPRAVVYRRVAEIAAAEGLEPNENGNVVPTRAMWERALDEVGVEGLPEHESLREDVRAGSDPSGTRPDGVEPGSSIEVDGSTGRAFWRPPDGGPGPGAERVVPL